MRKLYQFGLIPSIKMYQLASVNLSMEINDLVENFKSNLQLSEIFPGKDKFV
jgi:hypothetical protein